MRKEEANQRQSGQFFPAPETKYRLAWSRLYPEQKKRWKWLTLVGGWAWPAPLLSPGLGAYILVNIFNLLTCFTNQPYPDSISNEVYKNILHILYQELSSFTLMRQIGECFSIVVVFCILKYFDDSGEYKLNGAPSCTDAGIATKDSSMIVQTDATNKSNLGYRPSLVFEHCDCRNAVLKWFFSLGDICHLSTLSLQQLLPFTSHLIHLVSIHSKYVKAYFLPKSLQNKMSLFGYKDLTAESFF